MESKPLGVVITKRTLVEDDALEPRRAGPLANEQQEQHPSSSPSLRMSSFLNELNEQLGNDESDEELDKSSQDEDDEEREHNEDHDDDHVDQGENAKGGGGGSGVEQHQEAACFGTKSATNGSLSKHNSGEVVAANATVVSVPSSSSAVMTTVAANSSTAAAGGGAGSNELRGCVSSNADDSYELMHFSLDKNEKSSGMFFFSSLSN